MKDPGWDPRTPLGLTQVLPSHQPVETVSLAVLHGVFAQQVPHQGGQGVVLRHPMGQLIVPLVDQAGYRRLHDHRVQIGLAAEMVIHRRLVGLGPMDNHLDGRPMVPPLRENPNRRLQDPLPRAVAPFIHCWFLPLSFPHYIKMSV
jgi:hypothetical protein